MKSNYQKLKSSLWIWILISAGVGLLSKVLVELIFMTRLGMFEFLVGSNGLKFIFFKVIFPFLFIITIFYPMFFLLSANFIKELNLQARSLLSLDKYVQFKEDYRFELVEDDKKYITDHSDQMGSYHFLRRITMRKPLHWEDKLKIVTFILWIVMSIVLIFNPNFENTFLFDGLLFFVASIVLSVYLFRRIKSLLHASRKVDELIEGDVK